MPVDSPLFWSLAILGVVITGVSKSGFAGGAGVVAVPLLALIMDVPSAAAMMLPLLLIMDVRTIHYYRQHAVWTELKLILPTALVGIVLGALVFAAIPSAVLKKALGLMCIVFAMWHSLAPLLNRFQHTARLWALISGLSSTLIHAGGPPINIYFVSRKLAKLEWLATAGLFFGAMNLIKVVPYTLLGQWQLDLLLVSAALIPFAFFGVKLGHWIQSRISEQNFLRISRCLLAVSGLMLLI